MTSLVKNQRAQWIVTATVWPALAVMLATQDYVYRQVAMHPISWIDAARYPAIEFSFWAVLTPLILHLARRFSLDRGAWWRNVAVLIACTLCIDVVHAAYRAVLHTVVYPPYLYADFQNTSLAVLWRFYVVGNFLNDLWIFWTLAGLSHVIEYYRRYRDRDERLSEAKLQVLKAQLQPHFLFNALNSIAALMHEDVDAADNMIADLGTLLRRTLQRGDIHEVTLAEELEILRLYLSIEKVRFQDRLIVTESVDPAAIDAMVPSFILQPLLENAIRHGIARRSGPGRINLSATAEGDLLRIAVVDDGPGLGSDQAAEGIGLSNTRARLRQHFGNRALLAVHDAARGGAAAEITMPYRPAAARA